MKRFLSVLLAICLLVGCLPQAASAAGETSGQCGDNVTWNFDAGSKTLTVSGTGPMYNYPEFERPWEDLLWDIQTVVIQPGVTEIGNWAFAYHKWLTDLTIPDSVTRVGENAFLFCERLANLTIPHSVTEIGMYGFSDCTSLTELTVPNSLTEIGLNSFSSCTGLTSVVIEDGATRIGVGAFHGCSSLTSVTIPDTVAEIGERAFADCTGLTSITIPGSVTEISELAFSGCTGLTSFTIPNSVTKIGQGAFIGCTGLTSIVIPDSITSISRSTFSDCNCLMFVTIPDSVTSIGSSAFDCIDLTFITIPESVTHIEQGAFYDWTGLTMYGAAGSAAEKYAKENHIPFVVGKAPDRVPAYGFHDVFQDDYYADAVKWAMENGISEGANEKHFGPRYTCHRAHAISFLWSAADKPEPAGTGEAFTDVPDDFYCKEAVQWAVEQGITSGTGSGKFSPTASCTRAQIVTFLYRAANSPAVTGEISFSDVPATAYYKDAVQWAAENNITSGTGGGKFSPNTKCTRGQIIAFLYRYNNSR